MCGRYVAVSSPTILAERFAVEEVRVTVFEPSYNVTPRAEVPVIAENGRGADQYGRGADDIHLRVPVGTVITDADTGERVADLATDGQEALMGKTKQSVCVCSYLCTTQRLFGAHASGCCLLSPFQCWGLRGGNRRAGV